jgi:excisionase family DNA binding protein
MELTDFQQKYGLTVEEVVQVLGTCERTVRKLIAEGKLPHFRVGRSVRIPWPDLKAWIENGGTKGEDNE